MSASAMLADAPQAPHLPRRTTMTTQSVITDEMRAAIGVEGEPYTVEVDKTSVRMFARAVGYADPVFYDEEFAKSKGYRSIPAPPHYLGTPIFNPNQPPSGRPRFTSPYKRGLNGGTD